MFDAGTGNADRINLLKGIITNQRLGHLPGNHHHRHRVHIGRRNTGHRIGGTRPRGHQHHAGLAGGAGIAVGRMRRRLLMTNQHMLNLVLPVERIIDMQHRAAGIPEDMGHPFITQTADYNFRTSEFHGTYLPPGSIPRRQYQYQTKEPFIVIRMRDKKQAFMKKARKLSKFRSGHKDSAQLSGSLLYSPADHRTLREEESCPI